MLDMDNNEDPQFREASNAQKQLAYEYKIESMEEHTYNCLSAFNNCWKQNL